MIPLVRTDKDGAPLRKNSPNKPDGLKRASSSPSLRNKEGSKIGRLTKEIVGLDPLSYYAKGHVQDISSTLKILEAEQKNKKNLRAAVKDPDYKGVIEALLQMLNSIEHPYGMVLNAFAQEMEQTCKQTKDHINTLSELSSNLFSFCKSMSSTIYLQYDEISRDIKSDDFNILCEEAIKECILSSDCNCIIDLYHYKFSAEDKSLMASVSKLVTLSPGHLGIPPHFWLTPTLDGSADDFGSVQPPYHKAIQVLRRFLDVRSPQQKVNVLRDTVHTICSCVEEYHKNTDLDPEKKAVAADDLVMLLSYVIIKSQVEYLYSETDYIYDFSNQNELTGEVGYIITTFKLCLGYLENVEISELEANAAYHAPNKQT